MIALAWVAKLSDKGLYLIDDITAWLRNNYNTHITQYLPN